jgi:hypothetical protein
MRAQNAVLIVEFARQQQEHNPKMRGLGGKVFGVAWTLYFNNAR